MGILGVVKYWNELKDFQKLCNYVSLHELTYHSHREKFMGIGLIYFSIEEVPLTCPLSPKYVPSTKISRY